MTSELVEQDRKRGRLSGALQVVNLFHKNIIVWVDGVRAGLQVTLDKEDVMVLSLRHVKLV